MLQSLHKPIDNSPLILFRIFFGLLMFGESVGAILTGWVHEVLILPKFTFSFIGFEWLQPLPGLGMYFYYGFMAVLSICIMLGAYYKFSTFLFALMWSGVYFMQKTSYNNHYYLLVLLSFIMFLLPAHRLLSWDSRKKTAIKTEQMPNYIRLFFIAFLWIFYSYAAINKIYPDWLEAKPIEIWVGTKSTLPIIGNLYTIPNLPKIIAISAILFDGLIVPAFLWKRTRKLAFVASIVFHIFNSITFGIGVFPYLALSFLVWFYPTESIRKRFLSKWKNKPELETKPISVTNKILSFSLIIFLIWQIYLPMRHHFIKGDVLWTEEGHRCSWRMMLRSKQGNIQFIVKTNEATNFVDLDQYITLKQKRALATHPDMIWQFAQRLKKEYLRNGVSKIHIYAYCFVSVNGRPKKRLIDQHINLAEVEWNRFGHNEWILPFDENE